MTILTDRQEQLTDLFRTDRLIPVITIHNLADAVPLAQALVSGGVRLLEITLRTEVGLAVAQAIVRQVPEAVVGIGTVMTPDDLSRAVDIGARIALSPGATPSILDAAASAPIPIMPGIATASDLKEAIGRGLSTVKLFPATAVGGIALLQALVGPFPQARFCPTGGVAEDNATARLALPNVVAVGGTWLTPPAEITARYWEAVRKRAQSMTARLEKLNLLGGNEENG